MIKGIVFDLDGTTLYTLDDMCDCLNEALSFYNFPNKTIQEVKLAIGRGSKKLIISTVPENTSEEVIEEVYKKYTETYFNCKQEKTRPYDGVIEVLKELQSKNILLSINSNKYDELTKDLINRNFKDINFISVIGSREGIPNKPDPYSTNEIIEKMKLNKDEVLYIGDSEQDYKTASNSGLKFIGCTWGFRGRKILEEIGAENIIDEPKDILKYIE